MQCMKCGREAEADQVFCPECLASMERFPVKPGTHVTIPVRPRRERVPQIKKEKPEEIILKLRRKIRGLTIAVITLTVALSLSLLFLYFQLSAPQDGPAIGSNYSTTDPVSHAPHQR